MEKSDNGRRRSTFFQGFVLHIHPPKVAEETLRFRLSFGLGGMSATLLLLLFISGILQLLSYTPDTAAAYDSVKAMYKDGSFSGWIRNIHYWSGNLLVIVAVLHCCRVFLTGAIAYKRGKNWCIGLLLLGLVLFANFSGYLLPWDQLAFWAVTIFTGMLGYFPIIGEGIVQLLRGGSEIGQPTLSLFYNLHTGVLPFFFVVLLFYHFWLVRKAGGLIQKKRPQDTPAVLVPTLPNLLAREAAVGLTLTASLLLFSALVDAPLDEAANPAMSPNPAKAAWFFLGFQEMLMHLHPTYAIFVLPLFIIAALLIIPFWQGAITTPGYWFGGERGGKIATWACLTSIIATFAIVFIDENLRKAGIEPTAADVLSRGVVPVASFLGFYCSAYFVMTRLLRISSAQTIMAGFVFSFSAIISLTVIGIWLRGPGMKLLF